MENGCAKSNAVTVVSFEIEYYWNIVFMFSNFGHIDWCEWNEFIRSFMYVRVFFFFANRNEMTQAKTSANRMANLRKNECRAKERGAKKNYRRWG